jgi:ferritin-like metal-binding protein YciE
MADPTTGDIKLVQYLNEAYGKEKELETALQAHIQMTTAKAYRKRLQDHLKETKAHARASSAASRSSAARPRSPRLPARSW